MSTALRANAPALVLAGALAFATKAVYSHVAPDQLVWVATPTQAIVTALTGLSFAYEGGYGYVNLAHRVVIAKACLGVNYLLAVFALIVLTIVPAVAGVRRKVACVLPAAVAALAVTVLVNAVRIAIGIELAEAGVRHGVLTPERVHRAMGVVVYVAGLVLVQMLAQAMAQRVSGAEVVGTAFLPLACYVAVAVALPLANGALRARPALFVENALTLAAIASALVGFAALARRSWSRPVD